jgi:hypothetical protein
MERIIMSEKEIISTVKPNFGVRNKDLQLMKCPCCSFKGPPSEFPRNASLKILKTCGKCLTKVAVKQAGRAGAGKENQGEEKSQPAGKSKVASDHPPMLEWEIFISLLKNCCDHACELNAFVTDPSRTALTPIKNCHDWAIAVSRVVWEATGYCFKYVCLSAVAASVLTVDKAIICTQITLTYFIVHNSTERQQTIKNC